MRISKRWPVSVSTVPLQSSSEKLSMKPSPTSANVVCLNDAPRPGLVSPSAAVKTAGTNLAVAALMREHGRSVRTHAERIVGSDDAGDVTQRVWLRVSTHLDTFRGDCSMSTWLFRITHNCAVDQLRRRDRERRVAELTPLDDVADVIADPAQTPLERLLQRERIQQITAALAELPVGMRQAFVLVKVHGLKAREAGAVLNIQTQTVKSRVYRARAHLRAAMN